MLEEDNKLMVDGPHEVLEGVTVYEIETDKRVTQGKGGGKSGKKACCVALHEGCRTPQSNLWGQLHSRMGGTEAREGE